MVELKLGQVIQATFCPGHSNLSVGMHDLCLLSFHGASSNSQFFDMQINVITVIASLAAGQLFCQPCALTKNM